MSELAYVVLASEPALPTGTGWVVLIVSLLITVAWLLYLYR
ncbi:hypothetical protein [Salinilacihabitans rarus]|nr:hypothetical protein [Salinilacihabitans rarus]